MLRPSRAVWGSFETFHIGVKRQQSGDDVTRSNISVQLYTVRELAAEDLGATLQRLADVGFTQVEPYAFTAFSPALGEGLRAAGLTAPTTHERLVDKSDSELDAIFAHAAQLGIATVIDPQVHVSRWQDAASVRQIAEALNMAGVIASQHGVGVGYHNHAHEIASTIDGVTAIEYLATLLDPAVGLEIDSYWAAVGGQDPVALLERLGERVIAVHVKDGPPSADNTDQVAVGAGAMPIAQIIAASPQALHVIELDDSSGDRFEAVAESFAFLSALGAAAPAAPAG